MNHLEIPLRSNDDLYLQLSIFQMRSQLCCLIGPVAGDIRQRAYGHRPMDQRLRLIFFELAGILWISAEISFLKEIPFNAIQGVEVARELRCLKIGMPVCEEERDAGIRYFPE